MVRPVSRGSISDYMLRQDEAMVRRHKFNQALENQRVQPRSISNTSRVNPPKHLETYTQRAEMLENDSDGQIKYTIEEGDNLTAIARSYGLDLGDLQISNPELFTRSGAPDRLEPGETVLILDGTRRDATINIQNAIERANALENLLPANPEVLEASENAWAEVRELAVADLYYAGANSSTPIENLEVWSNDLLSRLPVNPRVIDEIDSARREVEQVWRDTGRTTEVQNELIALTDSLGEARYIGNGIEDAEDALNSALIDILSEANTSNSPSDPMVRLAGVIAQAEAMASNDVSPDQAIAEQLVQDELMPDAERSVRAQALTLMTYGPDNSDFVDAVKAAEYTVLAEYPAEEVADAYQEGGAPAAMEKLRELTSRDIASSDTAAAILTEAKPTIDKVIADINEFESDSILKYPSGAMPPEGRTEYEPSVSLELGDRLFTIYDDLRLMEQILADLSAVSDLAINGQGGQKIVRDIAADIIDENADWTNIDLTQVNLESRFFYQPVAGGDGAALQMEIIKQLVDAGRDEEAEYLFGMVRSGANALEDGVRSTVHNFTGSEDKEGSGTEFITLVSDWQNLLTDQQLANAIEGYIQGNPDTMQAIEADLDRIGIAGFSMTRFEEVWKLYEADLVGLNGHGEIKSVVEEFEKEGNEFELASTSPESVKEVARLDNNAFLSDAQGSLLQPASTVRALARSLAAGALYAYADMESILPNTKPGILTNGSSSLLAGGASALLFTQEGGPQSLPETLYAWYFGAASLKEGVEFSSGLAVALDKAKQNGIIHHIGTAQSPKWKIASKGLGAIGAGIDFYSAADTASKGGWENWVSAGFSATSGTAGILTVAGVGSGAALGVAIPIIGAIAIAGGLGFNKWRNVQDSNKYEGPTEEFLIDAGFKPEIAKELSNHDGKGVSIAIRLEALADYQNIEPQELLDWLDEQDHDFVNGFVRYALHPVKPDENGQLLEKVDEETFVSGGMYSGEVVVYPALDPNVMSPLDPEVWDNASVVEARSLNGIRLWAEASRHPLPRG